MLPAGTLPAGTGDRVVLLGAAATNPTARPAAGTGTIVYHTTNNRFGLFGSNSLSQTTVGAAGAAAALPALPLGYLRMTVDGTDALLPFYTAI